jgi:signal transduction histidine kinase
MLELASVIIVIIVSVSLGLVIFYNNPKSATNRIFSLFATSIIFWAVIMLLTVQPLGPELVLFFIRLSMLAAIAMSTCVLFLSHTIPSDTFRMNKKIAAALIFFAFVGMAVAMSPFMFTGLKIEGANIEPITGPGMIAFLLTGLGYSISGIFILRRKYKRSRGRERNQLRYVLLGISLMHVLLIWANFIVVLVFKSSAYINLGPLFTLTFLISAAYAIIKHRLMDIRLVVARAVSFTLVILIATTIYALILFRTLQFIPADSQNYFSIALAIILAYTFPYLNRFIEHITTGIFYRQPYSSEMFLERLGEMLRSTLSLHTLLKSVTSELRVSIQPSSAWFIIISDQNEALEKIGYGKQLNITPNALFNLKKMSQNESMIMFDDLEEGAEKDFIRQLGISVLIPLRVKEKLHGFLLMGEKSSGNIFSAQDSNVMEILAPQLSIAVQNALSYEEINQFNQTLKQEVGKATADLKKANLELTQLDKLKDEFVFIATHELKNPVTAMRGYLSMFQEGLFGDIPEKMKEPMHQLQASNQQLVELVNDLLQIARSEAETLSVHTEPINLCPTIDSVMQNLKPLSDQKGLEMIHLCPGSIPQVLADNQRVREILNNLINNAIKYSDKGTITISHQLKIDQLITHIADQGVGIAPKDQKQLYTRFFRVEEEAAKGIPGTGLGLFVVKQLVEKMGGQIWVESEKGIGSTFSFSLPTA